MIRRHVIGFTRILFLGMLLLGVVLKPAVSLAGQLHDVARAGTVDAELGGNHHVSNMDDGDTDNPWHQLLHLDHCCGATAAFLLSLNTIAVLPWASQALAPHTLADLRRNSGTPLRPPIRG
jgi:hypothetical protein